MNVDRYPKYKAVAKHDLVLEYHTWTEGLEYEVVDRGGYFIIASDRGQTNYMWEAISRLADVFVFNFPAELVKLKEEL